MGIVGGARCKGGGAKCHRASPLCLWSASEVCVSAPIELRLWSGGTAPRKIFVKLYSLECIFTIEFTFQNLSSVVTTLTDSASGVLYSVQYINTIYLNINVIILQGNSTLDYTIRELIARACECYQFNKCTSLRMHLLQLSNERASLITAIISLLLR